MPVGYEWLVEVIEVDGSDDPDIIDHFHSDKLKTIGFTLGDVLMPEHRLCIVRDTYTESQGVTYRAWCYATVNDRGVLELPDVFSDAHGREIIPVPVKLKKEFTSWLNN